MTENIISPITYYGAKSSLSEWIISHFPEHKTYVEVFGGSGIVLLRKEKTRIEIYNDINRMLADLFRILRYQHTANMLHTLCDLTPYSRDEFNDSKQMSTDTLENARRAMVLFNMSYSGNGRFFSTSVKDAIMGMPSCVRRWEKRKQSLQSAHERLKNIIVEHEDFRKLIPRYDSTDALFYLDPPYHMSTRDGKNRYLNEFKNKDHEDLIQLLLNIKGAAVVSGYNCSTYKPLEDAGYIRYDKESIVRASSVRTRRIESIWVKQKNRL